MAERERELGALAEELFDAAERALEGGPPELSARETGRVAELGRGLARVRGLPGLGYGELVRFEGGALGLALDLLPDEAAVALLTGAEGLRPGAEARRGGGPVDLPVGPALLGRVVDPLGRPLDGGGPIHSPERLPAERPAPPILDRAPVERPLQTGVLAVDALIPIGRGQRELIIGDRQLGKTALALSAILNQQEGDLVSVYCAIGQQGAAVERLVEELEARGALGRCVVVVAGGEDPPGLNFLAPYAAAALAESFAEKGGDSLLILDDLSKHARSYRELSLLMRRPPSREAYPGDIFYIHSRLLERATQFSKARGGGSLTVLPIVETEAQNIAAYIPTNLVSITDGQIYLAPRLFQRGQLPAVDVGVSVSRVGGKAQAPAYAEVAADLRIAYSQFEELEIFERWSSRLDESTRRSLERGKRIREALRQGEGELLSFPEQIALLLALTRGLFDGLPLAALGAAMGELRRSLAGEGRALAERLEREGSLGPELREGLLALGRRAAAGCAAADRGAADRGAAGGGE